MAARPATHTLAAASMLPQRARAPPPPPPRALTSTKPLPIWSSSRKDWSLWSTVPLTTLPAQLEQAPARQL